MTASEQPPETRCASCERPMVAQTVHRAAPARWRARGFVRQSTGDLCSSCDARQRRGSPQPSKQKSPRAPIDPAVVAQLRRAAGLPPGGAS